jgi:large subunit ribosomal protein L24
MAAIKKGENVKVLRGKDSGKEGEILMVIKNDITRKPERVIVKGVNISKKSVKPNAQLGIAGGIFEIEKSIHISNVMKLDGSKPVRATKTKKSAKVDTVKNNSKE